MPRRRVARDPGTGPSCRISAKIPYAPPLADVLRNCSSDRAPSAYGRARRPLPGPLFDREPEHVVLSPGRPARFRRAKRIAPKPARRSTGRTRNASRITGVSPPSSLAVTTSATRRTTGPPSASEPVDARTRSRPTSPSGCNASPLARGRAAIGPGSGRSSPLRSDPAETPGQRGQPPGRGARRDRAGPAAPAPPRSRRPPSVDPAIDPVRQVIQRETPSGTSGEVGQSGPAAARPGPGIRRDRRSTRSSPGQAARR